MDEPTIGNEEESKVQFQYRTDEEKQADFCKWFRKKNYVVEETLKSIRVKESTFRRWMVEDQAFVALFEALEEEQKVFMMQTAREIATGNHPSCEGQPDKAMLKWLLTMYDKRVKKPLADREQELLGELGDLSPEEEAMLLGEPGDS